MAPNMDRHLVFPLLEFLQERELYSEEELLQAKIELLNDTNMVDYAMDIHKSLYHTEDVPQEMVERRAEVLARLKALDESALPLVTFLQNPNAFQELRADKMYNLQMLNDRYQVGLPSQLLIFSSFWRKALCCALLLDVLLNDTENGFITRAIQDRVPFNRFSRLIKQIIQF
ncbi:hypothetical protein Drorol1_Dr00015388 [Drosera rotundifolia]